MRIFNDKLDDFLVFIFNYINFLIIVKIIIMCYIIFFVIYIIGLWFFLLK